VAQLAAMQGVDQTAARDAVDCLVEKGLFVGAGRDALTFSHGLVRDVAHDELVRTRRARLHGAAAAWIEEQAGDRVAFEAMRIANHLAAAASDYEEEGRDTTDLRHRSFRMMIIAGERLEGLGAEEVVSRLAAAADGHHSAADLAELHGRRAAALARLGRLREAADAAALGSDAARQAGDPALEARLAATMGEIQWLRGETAACVSNLDRALTLVADLPRDRAATQAIATLAFVTALLGRPAEAIGLAEQGLALAREHGLPDKEVRCLNARGAALLLQGDLEGYNDFMRALARALEAGLGHESAMAYHNLAELHLQGVGPASSADMNEQGMTLAERRGLTLAADWLRSNRVQVFFEAGRWDEALALADIVLADEARAGVGQAGTACLIWAARIHVWRGDLPYAARLVETFLPRARRHAVIQQLGPALVVAGLVETASGRPEVGADYAAEFCALTEDTRAYRQQEIADVVRLLVAASRHDDAETASANDVIQTIRNQCHALTAEAVLAAAAGAPDAADRFDTAADRWRTYGHPLETQLAVLSAAARREGGPAGGVDVPPGVSAASVATLSAVPGVATCSRPIRNQPARPSW
jgi:tetratricopeptide (TPR) repeat protein